MITGIRTNNFKKLENFSATFVDGTNLIFGENGEGKSSCYEALRFALFGSKGVTGSIDSLTTWGKDKMWVELDIKGFTIRRTSSNCKITNADGEVVASGNTPSIKFVEELLACSVKDFDLLYMSKQGETAGLITFGATELNRKVEEYAGVAVIDKVIKALGSEVNGTQIALQSFEYVGIDGLEKEAEELEATINMLLGRHKLLGEDELNTRTKIGEVKGRLQEKREFNERQDQLASEAEGYNKRIERLKASVEACKSGLNKAQDIMLEETVVDSDQIEEVRDQLEKVNDLNVKLSRIPSVADLNVKLEEAQTNQAAFVTYQDQLPALEKAKQTCQAEFDKCRDANQTALSEYKKACSEAENGICGSCNRPLEGHDPEQAKAKSDEKGKAVSNSKVLMDAAKANLDSAERALSEHHKTNPGSNWEQEAADLQAKIDKAKSDKTHLEQQLSKLELAETLQTKLTKLTSDQRSYLAAKRTLDAAQSDLEETEARLVELESQSVAQPQPKQCTKADEAEYSDLNDSLNKLVSDLGNTKAEGSAAREKLNGIKNQLENAKANNERMAKLESDLSVSKQLRKYLNEERVKFMEGVWRTILGTASHFINKSTDGWITAVGRNDKGDFTFTENGHEAVAKESASGAQKAFIGTAIKVGLAQAKMGSSAMILLDEPTADMRDDRAAQLAAGLMMLSGQKIMITHRDSERMIAQNIIQVGE